ncbi:ABC transporter permease [Paracoccus sp. M683]|uniref:ABC transporter permease n=1 Tax=Paracoccus sp. M683 TaxID=2594268 RepID=UPI00118125D2|nr:ABC transporter permease [Paracoccus sp. M683]TRW93144.1 ABC transporter permease [Paracoccus sp. M683]
MPELSPRAVDALLALALVLWPLLCGLVVLRGFRPWRVILAMLRRAAGTAALFVGLIAVSLALGLVLTAQERALRQATARAADPFDVVVAAPGSEVTAMLAAIYLQPADIPLLTGAQMAEIAATPGVRFAAPIGFGDSVEGAPIVGTTAELVTHLAGPLAEGRGFERTGEAVAGALTRFAVGSELEPAHGVGAAAEEHAHAGEHLVVVGRLARTGGPWDHALVTPIETLWYIHKLPYGHAPEAGPEPGTEAGDRGEHVDRDNATGTRIGPPWVPALFPGVPAVVVDTGELAAAYAVRSTLNRPDLMAFFPGAVLSQLHGLLGDVRAALSVMALASQVLVTVAVLAGLSLVMALFSRQFQLLAAMGAPTRFVMAVSWGFSGVLILAGTALGAALAVAGMSAASRIMTGRMGIDIHAALGWPELHMAAAFVALMMTAALLSAGWQVLRN